MNIKQRCSAFFEQKISKYKTVLLPREERGPISWYFLGTFLVILAYGLIIMFSASYPTGYYRKGDSYYYIKQQLQYAGLGLILVVMGATVSYRWIRKLAWPLYAATLLLLVMALLTPMREGFDFHRWIFIGSSSFQPSELSKFLTILLTAHLIDTNRKRGKTICYGVLLPAGILAPVCILIFLEPHFSCLILVAMIFCTMLVCSHSGGWKLYSVIVGLAAGFYVLLNSQNNYVADRLGGWTPGSLDTSTMPYQTVQSLYSIASGGLFGLGIGNSRQKHLWLPEATNDFVFAVVCEELGFVGAVVCIVLFAALILQGINIALRAPDLYGTLLGIGIMAQIAWQVAFNIAVVTSTIPNTGISLPFFSSGGTSLLMLMAQMGIMLSISRAGNAKELALRKARQQELAAKLGTSRVYRKGQSF